MTAKRTRNQVFDEINGQVSDQIHHEVWDKVMITRYRVHRANRVWRQICIELMKNVI